MKQLIFFKGQYHDLSDLNLRFYAYNGQVGFGKPDVPLPKWMSKQTVGGNHDI